MFLQVDRLIKYLLDYLFVNYKLQSYQLIQLKYA